MPYKLEHLQPDRVHGLPLFGVRLSPTDAPYAHYKESYLNAWEKNHGERVHQIGYNLYFDNEPAALLFMLGHNYA